MGDAGSPGHRPRSPWVFVPALYLVVGIGGGGVLGALASILFKDLGWSNAVVGGASLLALPSALRFLWAPRVDRLAAKRPLCWRFTAAMALTLLALAGLLAAGFAGQAVLFGGLLLFAVFLSCQEIAADGYYIRIFDRARQAEFVGLKAAAVRLGILLVVAGFVTAAGVLRETRHWPKAQAWAASLAVLAGLLLLLALLVKFLLPPAPDDTPVRDAGPFPLARVLREYLRQPGAWAIIATLLVFRFGEGMLTAMSAPFYMDGASGGGFGMSAREVGVFKTLTDLPWAALGGIAGGFLIKRFGFRRTVYPFTLALTLPNFAYIYLAAARPAGSFVLLGQSFSSALFWVSSIESFGYGFGFSAFYYYIHAIATGRHKTSLLAISTGILVISYSVPGAISGVIQERLGYVALFSICSIGGLLTFALLPFLPDPPGICQD